jgi:hypothetical protein
LGPKRLEIAQGFPYIRFKFKRLKITKKIQKKVLPITMDLLGSILGSMEKPPSASDAEKKKIKG